jgi:NTP pyrophosphatase (non-canonical NTP hydrolase)
MIDDSELFAAGQETAIREVLAERRRQFVKWGKQHHSPEWWLAILMEEVGELAECILHDKFGGPEAKNRGKELVQVAAVALAMLEDGV